MSFANGVTRILDIASRVAIIVVGGVILWSVLLKRPDANAPSNAEPIESAAGMRIPADLLVNVIGSGPIAIVEFSDYECPYCRTYAQTVYPIISRDLIRAGRVRYVAMHFPLERIHPFAMAGSEAAECAAQQGRFWNMHDQLFTGSIALTPNDIAAHARTIALDMGRFQKCVDTHDTRPKIDADRNEGLLLSVRGTPVFFVGTVNAEGGLEIRSRIRGVAPYEVFAQQVSQLEAMSALKVTSS